MWKGALKFPFLHRRELIATVISILIFIIVLFSSSELLVFQSNYLAKKEKQRIEVATKTELSEIFQHRKSIIDSRVFVNPLNRNNPLEILTTSQLEAEKRNIYVVLVDKDGFVFSRSHLPGQIGDNVFQTTIQGRLLAKGKTVTDVVRGARSPLALMSASPIIENNETIGSIIVGRILDDAYSAYVKNKYFKKGEEIIFYTPQEGIVGDSLNDKDKTHLISTFFSLNSDLGSQNITNLSKEIKIDNKYYVIQHIVFPGIEESPGGAIILFPVNHVFFSFLLAGIITFLFFIFYFLTIFLLKDLYHHKHRIHILLLVGFILFVLIYLITLMKLNNSVLEIKKPSYLIYNSTMKFEPESDIISESSEKIVAIKVFTGGEIINAVSVVVSYDPKAVEIIDILTTNSFCEPSLFLEKEISVEKGEVKITCGLPNPGFSGATATVAELLIKPLGLNSINLEFAKETQVLANDGLGTNVLRMVTNGYYQVIPPKFDTTNIQSRIPIFSLSHPNNNRWYRNKNIKLYWPLFSNGTYYYNLNQDPFLKTEDKMLSTTNNQLDISVNQDGIYYFHLKVKDKKGEFGPVSNFKIMVDNTPPLPPDIKVSSNFNKKGDVLRLDFTSEDSLSGLQSGFYININNNVFLPVNPPFFIPFLESGRYPITVRVFDQANNFSDNQTEINVSE